LEFPVQDIATNPPAHRRAGFEVAGWDGARWILEGIYDSGVEAATQAKVVLGKRLGVKVTQEVYNAVEGTFKGRVVFTEYRGDPPKSEKRKTAGPPTLARPRTPRELIGASDAALYVAIGSLIVSIIAMVFSIMR
jgi:hypothetical protein